MKYYLCIMMVIVIAGEVSVSMGFNGEDAEQQTGVLDFIRAKADEIQGDISAPPKVLAFYYTWYGRPENHGNWVHWGKVNPDEHDISQSTHYPAIGAYDSHDPEVIDYHIKLAQDNGIDAFICTWWGQGRFDDRAFVKILERAKEKNFEVTVYWETAPGKGREKIDNAVDDLVYILEKYSKHPAFLKVDDKPVIFVYGRVMNQVSMSEWPAIITGAQKKSGMDFLLIADGYQDGYARMFDGIHTYNICGWVQGKSVDELRKLSKQSFARAVDMARKRGRISCITIIPGYDDTKIRTPGINAERMDGDTYRVLWEEAIAAKPDWVLITSWNEWHEGSEIEPSWEHGDKYIRMTGKYAAQFKEERKSEPITASVPPPAVPPEKARDLREIYAGKSIGILPNFSSEAAFWLADTGVSIHDLALNEVIDPQKLNPTNFPVLVYAGGEGYTQTFKRKGDVDRALVKYLSEGGLLVAIPSMPFPFYRNEAGESVVSSSKFGFAVAMGWEFPPDDLELSFDIDNKTLKSLPESAPFPKTGDLRWRPSSREVVADGDVYLSLAELKDADGKSYGDGIAYVESGNSKTIYVWMRMVDVLNMNDLLYEVFRLAGDRAMAGER